MVEFYILILLFYVVTVGLTSQGLNQDPGEPSIKRAMNSEPTLETIIKTGLPETVVSSMLEPPPKTTQDIQYT